MVYRGTFLRDPDFRVRQGAPDRGPGSGSGSGTGPRVGLGVRAGRRRRVGDRGRALGSAASSGQSAELGRRWAQLGSMRRKRRFWSKTRVEMRFFKSQRFGKTPSGAQQRCFSVLSSVVHSLSRTTGPPRDLGRVSPLSTRKTRVGSLIRMVKELLAEWF